MEVYLGHMSVAVSLPMLAFAIFELLAPNATVWADTNPGLLPGATAEKKTLHPSSLLAPIKLAAGEVTLRRHQLANFPQLSPSVAPRTPVIGLSSMPGTTRSDKLL